MQSQFHHSVILMVCGNDLEREGELQMAHLYVKDISAHKRGDGIENVSGRTLPNFLKCKRKNKHFQFCKIPLM